MTSCAVLPIPGSVLGIKVRRWVPLGVIVVIVLADLLAASPSVRCRVTLGTWVPERPIERVFVGVSDTYWPVYYAEPADCVY